MDDIRKINLLEEISELSKIIQNLIIEKKQNENNFNEKLKIMYAKMFKLNQDLLRLIPIEKEQT